MSIYLEDNLPVVKHNGLNTTKDASFEGALSVTGAITGTAAMVATAGLTATTGNITLTTGNVVLSANGAGVSFTGTGTNGGILTNLYNSAASTLSGTQKDIKILIGTVPYYFTVYPSKA